MRIWSEEIMDEEAGLKLLEEGKGCSLYMHLFATLCGDIANIVLSISGYYKRKVEPY